MESHGICPSAGGCVTKRQSGPLLALAAMQHVTEYPSFSTVWTPHTWFTCSSLQRHLGCPSWEGLFVFVLVLRTTCRREAKGDSRRGVWPGAGQRRPRAGRGRRPQSCLKAEKEDSVLGEREGIGGKDRRGEVCASTPSEAGLGFPGGSPEQQY